MGKCTKSTERRKGTFISRTTIERIRPHPHVELGQPSNHSQNAATKILHRPTRQGRRRCCCRCDMHSYILTTDEKRKKRKIVKCTFYDERSMNTTMNSCDTTCRPRSVSISAIRFGCANCRLGIILRGRLPQNFLGFWTPSTLSIPNSHNLLVLSSVGCPLSPKAKQTSYAHGP